MHALDVIDHLARAGYEIKLSKKPGKLQVIPDDAPDEMLSLVREAKAEILALLDGNYPIDPASGAKFMPWCPPIHPDQFVRWRLNTIDMIEELADLQGWPREHLDDVLSRAINGPVSDLRPNWHHFTNELRQARQQHARRIRENQQAKQFSSDLFNRRK
ncbi:hypothetical protein [Robbsia andropogonis]|uniref:hypothetical protein n=1 Tax=Robbsia andropogonis TaxID=28092 RepID=UPI000466DC7D|nr:hypothetical protein [Robbsia andropogonis]